MKLSQFKFKLPEEQIALYPPHRVFNNDDGSVERVYQRDRCRLMVLHRKSQKIDLWQKDVSPVSVDSGIPGESEHSEVAANAGDSGDSEDPAEFGDF